MKHDHIFSAPLRRSYVVIDIESAVTDEAGHARYLEMERWTPRKDDTHSRRGYKRHEDPLKTPRWPFQTLLTASLMVLVEHDGGNLEVSRFVTLSAPDHDEREIVEGVFSVLAETPAQTELVSWNGAWHDLPLLKLAALKHGACLPKEWKWMCWGGEGRVPHIDLARLLTGGGKMKPVHMSEYAAALDIPAKLSAAPYAVARLVAQERWDLVQEVCEGDVITTALLLARWRCLLDPRADALVVQARILRQVEELRAGRSYVGKLAKCRTGTFEALVAAGKSDLEKFAPWLCEGD